MKKITLNILILIATYFVPLYIFHKFQNDYRDVDLRQYSVHIVLFIGGILLTYLNHKFRKQAVEKKWIWTIFEIIGVAGVLYSGAILLILFSFRHGIGF